jgi:hypothetical protein
LLRLAYMHLKSYESRRDREKAAAENASSLTRSLRDHLQILDPLFGLATRSPMDIHLPGQNVE